MELCKLDMIDLKIGDKEKECVILRFKRVVFKYNHSKPIAIIKERDKKYHVMYIFRNMK